MQTEEIRRTFWQWLRPYMPFIGFSLMSSRLEEEAQARRNPWLAKALEQEKADGQKIATWARTAALLVVAIMLVYVIPRIEVLYYQALVAGFIIIGFAQLRAARVGQSWLELALIAADLALLTLTLAAPNPFASEAWPTAIQYRFDGFMYFYIFLAGATLAYSWRTVLSIGMWAAIAWTAGIVCVFFFGASYPQLTDNVAIAMQGFERAGKFIDPNSLGIEIRVQEVVVFMIVAAILALKSRRSSQLLLRQADLAAERANLSRYFAPSMVEELATRNEPMGGVRSQSVAVLFADIVGFTRMAETTAPEAVIVQLRQVHEILEEAVFANNGTLDKYLGDGIMASFGTPNTSPADAANAVNAAFAMQAGIAKLNAKRALAGGPAISLATGIHFGPVILGDIGSERRMEFATLGDTVNVAARLEAATRQFSCSIIVSNTAMAAIKDTGQREQFEGRMKRHKKLAIRGRDEAVDVWLN